MRAQENSIKLKEAASRAAERLQEQAMKVQNAYVSWEESQWYFNFFMVSFKSDGVIQRVTRNAFLNICQDIYRLSFFFFEAFLHALEQI